MLFRSITNFLINPSKSLRYLPTLIQLYFRSTPFLPIIHLLDSIFLVSGARGAGYAFHTALPAFHDFLNAIRPESTLEIQRLIVSAIWTSIPLLQNAKYISSPPWFRFESIAERLLFIMNVGGVCVIVNEILVKVLKKYHRLDDNAEVWTRERAAALHYFHDSPNSAVDMYFGGSLGFAARIHCLSLIYVAAEFLLACCVWGSSSPAKDGGMGWAGAKCLIGVPVAFTVSVLAAVVLLATFEPIKPRVLSVVVATFVYALLLRSLGHRTFGWTVWGLSDSMLWAFGEFWGQQQQRRIWLDFWKALQKQKQKNGWC